MELTADALPVLKSKFDFDKCGWTEISEPEFIEITDKPADEIYITSFDTEKCPPLKIIISRKETDTLVFFLDHGVSDAHGFAGVVYLISQIYKKLGSGKSYEPKPIKLPTDRSYKKIFEKYEISELQKLAEEEYNKSELCKDLVKPYLADYPEDSKFVIVSEFVDSKYISEIKSFAHENNATVNDVLIAVYSLVLHEHFGGTPRIIPMRMAVDLRYRITKISALDKLKSMKDSYLSKLLSKMLVCTNCSVPVWLPIKLPEPANLKNILSSVSAGTKILKNKSRGVGSAFLIEGKSDVPSLFDSRQVLGGPFVSNAGIIDENLFNFGGDITVEELLPYIHFNTASPYSLAVVTWKGKITLSSVDVYASGLATGLLKRTKEILENIKEY